MAFMLHLEPTICISLIILSSLFTSTFCLSFNFTNFYEAEIDFDGSSASISGSDITLVDINWTVNNSLSYGRALYPQPLLLWDPKTREITDFTTHFTFVAQYDTTTDPSNSCGDGLAFFLSSYPAKDLAVYSGQGGGFGLFPDDGPLNNTVGPVAIEFDTYKNPWDPSINHIGIDFNSDKSTVTKDATTDFTCSNPMLVSAAVMYNSSSLELSVWVTYKDGSFSSSWGLNYTVDLRNYLPSEVAIGFSSAQGGSQQQRILSSWSFTSTLQPQKNRKVWPMAVASAAAAASLLILFAVAATLFLRRRTTVRQTSYTELIETRKGAKEYSYQALSCATNSFTHDKMLGKGGFGTVYRGKLDLCDVAIKIISEDSKQGSKEYLSEVNIIRDLQHRNLLQLIGWCHEKKGSFLIVYEYMPNGSLDNYLHRHEKFLDWPTRYNIVQGLASALVYLHHQTNKPVIHRDIKPSNVMLNSSFEAKLGDFGLARQVDYLKTSRLTEVSGTFGYLAPECMSTERFNRESDVYSFGVVLLEVGSGRQPGKAPTDGKQMPRHITEWVWDFYERNAIVETADTRLDGKFDRREMECLMEVGLWCAHHDPGSRPSITVALDALKFERAVPKLQRSIPME